MVTSQQADSFMHDGAIRIHALIATATDSRQCFFAAGFHAPDCYN